MNFDTLMHDFVYILVCDGAESNGLATRIVINPNQYERGDTEWEKVKLRLFVETRSSIVHCRSHNVYACIVLRTVSEHSGE